MEAALVNYRKKLDDLRAAGEAQKTSVTNLTVALGAMKQQLASLEAAGKGDSLQAKELRTQIAAYKKSLEGMNKTLADNVRETKRAESSLASFEKKVEAQRLKNEELRRTLNNLSGATYSQLLTAKRALKKELNNLVPGTAEFNRAMELLRQTTIRLSVADSQYNAGLTQRRGLLARVASAFNKYFLLLTTSATSITALVAAGRKAVAAFQEMEEAMAKVRKYAGLTDEEVKRLNRSLSNIDTRTSQLQLEALAADAGRLGIKGVENLTRFVETADKIKLSLGEGLGEDAVKNIGKLSQLFGEDKRLGLETAMMSAASAVTVLAENSSACEPYLVEFASRLGGVGETAHMTIADILGLGSALDQNMQKVEMSATALSTLIVNMAKDPAKFARLASIEVEEFTRLVREDMNEAVITFIQKMNDRGGLMEIAPMFDEMNMSGKRAVQVLTTLAQHTDKIREAQAQANKAYEENTEAQRQFDIMNNTWQAKREKHVKQIQALRVELGEKLQPVVTRIYSMGTVSLKLLAQIVDAFIKYRSHIAALIPTLVAYTVACRASVVWNKILSLSNVNLGASFRKLWAVLAKNPYVTIATAATALITLLYRLSNRTKEVTVAMRALRDVEKDAKEGLSAEAVEVNKLNRILHDNAASYSDREAALNRLKELVPGYHADLTEEGRLINDNVSALDEYIKREMQLSRARAARAKMDELSQRELELNQQLPELRQQEERYDNFRKTTPNVAVGSSITGYVASSTEALDKLYLEAKKKRMATEEELKQIGNAFTELGELIKSAGLSTIDFGGGNAGGDGGGGGGGDTDTKSALERLVEKYEGENGLITLLNEQYEDDKRNFDRQLAQKLITKEQYNVRMAELDRMHYAQLSGLYQSYHDEMSRIQVDKEGQRTKKLRSIHREREKSEDESAKARIRIEETLYDSLKKLEEGGELVSKRANPFESLDKDFEKREKSLDDYYHAALAANEKLYADEQERQTADLQAYQLYQQALLALDEWYADESDKLKKDVRRREFSEARRALTAEEKWQGMLIQQSIESEYDLKRKELDLYLQYEYMTEEEHQRALRDLRISEARAYYDQLSGYASTAIESLQQAEIDAVEAKYEVLIKAAENNGEDTAALETEQANAKLEIQKKYALSNLVMKLSQITADTAVAIMTGFAQLGPVAGAVAAALLAATGAAQYASALSEYNKVKAMSLSSTPSGTSSASAGTAMERVVQYASGRYDVIGASDGKTYERVPYVGPPQTGIVNQPALIAESGAELIVNATDLRRLKAHVNYGLVVEAINDARKGVVPQRAEGNYTALPQKASHVSRSDEKELLERLDEIKAIIRAWPTLIRAYLLLSDYDKANELRRRSEAPFTRKDNQ